VQGIRVGSEALSVTRTADGWTLASNGRLAAPVDQTTTKFELTYDAGWQPERMTVEGTNQGGAFTLSATFTATSASVTMDQNGQHRAVEQPVSARTIVLPPNVFAAYETMARRLADARTGTTWPVYVAGDAEVSMTVNAITPRLLTSPSAQVTLREFDVTFNRPSGFTAAELWIDADGHLARFVLPAQGVTLVRSDLSSVMLREDVATHPGDEAVFVPANGFNLAGTVSRPASATGRLPAVVLIAGMGAQTRDETTAGVPVLGQLAGALADAGYLVVRYDPRGAGQSGGRTEGATIATYADDVVQVVDWMRDRKDVDGNRVAVAGYGDGGWVALVAASREKAIHGVALLGTAARTGRTVTLDQQRDELAQMRLTDQDRAAKIALETRLLDAVATGDGWGDLPADLRRASDTPWFKSWVLFDPAAALARVSQPVLIAEGTLDRQVPPADADALETAARARKGSPRPSTLKVIIPGVNHLFVPARTGAIDEYATLPVRQITPDLASQMATWLRGVLVPKK